MRSIIRSGRRIVLGLLLLNGGVPAQQYVISTIEGGASRPGKFVILILGYIAGRNRAGWEEVGTVKSRCAKKQDFRA